jgi:hypothetical protein
MSGEKAPETLFVAIDRDGFAKCALAGSEPSCLSGERAYRYILASAAEARIAELEGALRVAIEAVDEDCHVTLAVLRAALTPPSTPAAFGPASPPASRPH